MKDILKNEKGSISVLGVIVTIIIVTVLSGYVSILNSSWVLNEVQSIMDLCATNALQSSLDSEALRKEVFGVVDENGSSANTSISNNGTGVVDQRKVNSILKNLYQKELNNNISPQGLIKKASLVSFDSDLVYSDWGVNYNSNSKKRPQLRLDAVVQITLKANSEFDGLNNYKLERYNAKNNQNMQITVNGVSNDGEVILTVRTLTRMVYK